MPRASPALTSFNAGELSPRLEGRVDTAKYAAGAKVCENYIPTIQGPAARRSGTRFVHAVKDSANRTWLVPFQFSAEQAYVLEFGDRYIRFYTNQGVVLSAGVPYEIVSPYTAADLTNADGTFALRTVESADVIYICLGTKPPQKLTRFGPTNWTIAPLQTVGGPFKTINLTATTVQASANTGTITLTASADIFQAGHVGSLFYLETDDLTGVKPWEGYAVLASGMGNSANGKTCRSGNRLYTCTTATAIVAAKGEIRTGTDRPEHVRGSAFDGRSEAVPNGPELAGVCWRFDGLTYGCVLITSFTDSKHVTATVMSMRDGITMKLPDAVVSSATTRWAYGAWSDVEGWPTHAAFFRQRLTFARVQQVWMSTAADFENFNEYDDNGVVTSDAAIKLPLPSEQVDNICWMRVLSPTVEALMIGTSSEEFAVKSQTENQPFGTDNVTAQLVSSIGSRNVNPVKIGPMLLFVQRLGVKLRDLTFDAGGGGDGSNDQTLYAEHVPRPKLDQLAYAQDPGSIIWAIRSDGQLVAMTYSREQYADPPHGGWHRHPMANGVVESIATIQGADRSELWMIVNRPGGRYVELLEADFVDGDALEDAFFVDSGITYNGSPATHFTGAGHIAGQVANVIADGAARPQVTVAGDGSFDIDVAASVVSVGLPLRARLQTMRLNAGGADGTSQGKKSKIPQGVIRLQNTVGLKYGASFDPDRMVEMDFRQGEDNTDEAIPLFTGDKEFFWPDAPDGYNMAPWLCFEQSDPLPGTIVAVFPQVLTSDKG